MQKPLLLSRKAKLESNKSIILGSHLFFLVLLMSTSIKSREPVNDSLLEVKRYRRQNPLRLDI